MKNLIKDIVPGNQIIDIRDGVYHIVIDKEIFDSVTLFYTDNNTAVPSTYAINTEHLVSSHLLLREINNQPITEWLRKNNELTISIKVRPDFNVEELLNKIIEKRKKPLSFWSRLKSRFVRFFK